MKQNECMTTSLQIESLNIHIFMHLHRRQPAAWGIMFLGCVSHSCEHHISLSLEGNISNLIQLPIWTQRWTDSILLIKGQRSRDIMFLWTWCFRYTHCEFHYIWPKHYLGLKDDLTSKIKVTATSENYVLPVNTSSKRLKRFLSKVHFKGQRSQWPNKHVLASCTWYPKSAFEDLQTVIIWPHRWTD